MMNKINMIKKFVKISLLLLISFAIASVSIAADTTPPVITFTDNVEAGPVARDTIIVVVTDDTDSDLEYQYGYSSSSTCDANVSFFPKVAQSVSIAIDSETNNGKYFCVKAEDTAENIAYLSSTNDVNINLAPTNISLSSTSIDENVADNTEVGTLSNTDPSITSNTHTYTLAANGSDNDDNGDFTISGTNLRIKKSPDFETKSSYKIRINVNDGVTDFSKAFTITVNDVDEAPVITNSESGVILKDVNENTSTSTTVFDAVATDDDGGALTYSLSGTDAPNFNISNTGKVTFKAVPDFENPVDLPINGQHGANNAYSVIVTVTDSDNLSDTQSVTFRVQNVNEAPTITSSAIQSADENQTAVATLTATDEDAGQTPTFSTTITGADRALFTLTSAGVLTFKTAPDFENPGSATNTNTYVITVEATDGALKRRQTVTITVNDVNEAPVITNSQSGNINRNVNENTPTPTVVFDGVATDQDGDTLTYTLAGTDAPNFNISNTGKVTFKAIPDFENPVDLANNDGLYGGTNGYNIQVVATDPDGLLDTQNITVRVIDVNVAPTAISLSSTSIKENQSNGTTVGTLSVTDDGEQNDETYTYTLNCSTVGSDDNFFKIESDKLKQNNAEGFNFERESAYNICIKVTETNGNLTYQENFVISIEDVAEGKSSASNSSSKNKKKVCRDEKALNYQKRGIHRKSLCKYGKASGVTSTIKKQLEDLEEELAEKQREQGIEPTEKGTCSTSQMLTKNLRSGSSKNDRKQAMILQEHLNRLGFSSGKVDGILGPVSDKAIKRMQAHFKTTQDGVVGPKTRALLNNSCTTTKTTVKVTKTNKESKATQKEKDKIKKTTWRPTKRLTRTTSRKASRTSKLI